MNIFSGWKVKKILNAAHPERVGPRIKALFEQHEQDICQRTDKLFAVLMIVQWIGGIVAAFVISPKTWIGGTSYVHFHIYMAIFLGGVLQGYPIYLAFTRPGEVYTRHVIAISQALVSALLIHLTGGRIETHFHVFGSLAFIAFYRDWKVMLSVTAVVAADHLIRGLYFPQSVFGVLTTSSWRWLEHAAWVFFEDIFLISSILQSQHEMMSIAERQANMEAINETIEITIKQKEENISILEDHLRDDYKEAA